MNPRRAASYLSLAAFWLLVLLAVARDSGGLELRLGALASSGLGEAGAQPVVAVEHVGAGAWTVRGEGSARLAEKVDGGAGYAAAAGAHVGRRLGIWTISAGVRASRLDVARYSIDTVAPVLTVEAGSLRLELSKDDSERETELLRVLWRHRWLWASVSAVRYGGLGGGPGGDGWSAAIGYRKPRY